MGPDAASKRLLAALQILDDVVGIPGRQSAGPIAGEIRREPTLQGIALQLMTEIVAAEESLRGMTGATVPGPGDDITAPVPGS